MLLYGLIALVVVLIAFLILGIVKKRSIAKRNKIVNSIAPELEDALKELTKYYNFGHYITESERLLLNAKYKNLHGIVKILLRFNSNDKSPHQELLMRFNAAMSDTTRHKAVNNEHFINNQKTRYKEYFDNVLSHPLDDQQREAIVSLEDNVLVIASAGSGKTMTTVGKVRYLVDVQHVSPEKILMITFTRKAAESLSERLGEKELKCRTFHKLALDIISEVTGEKPTICGPDFPALVYHNLFSGNTLFRQAIADYIIRARYKMRDCFSYSSMADYMRDRKKYGVKAAYCDMDGEPVFCKSDQESMIADFLGSRGIRFKYEKAYEYRLVDANHSQYKPDFSIYFDDDQGNTHRIYLEHFAVNDKGHCPSFFSAEEEQNYLDGIKWKRTAHLEHQTVLLETTSALFHNDTVFDKLTEMLKSAGVSFNYTESNALARELAHQEENILAMLTAFTSLMKSRGLDINIIKREADNNTDKLTLRDIVEPFLIEYSRLQQERNEIDFTDAIIKATYLCNKGNCPDYDYILVDEFQDISMDRYRFLQALRRKEPLTKLFCVGDDWQSIYRFTGSDMALFRSFSQFFGYTKKCLMETTYRFGEPAIEESSKFILANPGQESKEVHSFKSDLETKLDFVPTNNRLNVSEKIKEIVDQLPLDADILLLGRYSFDVEVLKDSDLRIVDKHDSVFVDYGERRMKYLTVHKSKGLEGDYVILLNCNGGTLGFPASIADSPILKYVLSEPDAYDYSEERRVFYVGITRARIHTWVLYDAINPSPFVTEFTETSNIKEKPIPEEELCPRCRCGRIRVLRTGVARNGNPYTVYICSNHQLGCDYLETSFVNLNSYRKRW